MCVGKQRVRVGVLSHLLLLYKIYQPFGNWFWQYCTVCYKRRSLLKVYLMGEGVSDLWSDKVFPG